MKKLLATVLALAMALALCTVSAWAAESPKVKIGTDSYTLHDALEKAENEGGAVIDLDGGTFDLTQSDNQYRSKDYPATQPMGIIDVPDNTTFKNGTFVISGVSAGEGVFHIQSTATFKNIRIEGTGYDSGMGVIYVNGGNATLKNCTFELTNETGSYGGVLKGMNLTTSSCTVEGGKYTLTNPTRVFGNLDLTMTGATVTVTNTSNEKTAFRNVQGTISSSTINVTGCEYGIEFSSSDANLQITNNSKVSLSNSTKKDIKISTGSVTVDSTSTLDYGTCDSGTAILKLDLNGGTGTPSMLCCAADATVDLANYTPTKTGSTFQGWLDANGQTVSGTVTLKEVVTYTAQWSGSSGGSTYYAAPTPADDASKSSPKTFDAGVAMYGVMAVMSVTGMAYVGKKKF